METKVITDKQDLTFLSWSLLRGSPGTVGTFLKSYSDLGGKKIYYKLSDYDSVQGVVGHECVNELIVDRFLTVLGIDHLHYQLIHGTIMLDGTETETFLCASEDFKKQGEDKVALDIFYQAERFENESPMDFCIRMGWEKQIYEMLVVDFLILNRDRHGANIEVLRNKKKRTYSLAPLFDHGLSLVCRCHQEDEVRKVNVLEEKQVQCFVGSRNTKENLLLIPPDQLPRLNRLSEGHRDMIMEDLEEALPAVWRDKIWEMLMRRYQAYEDFCNQR